MFYTYILRSLSHPEQRYIGSTSDLHARIAKHNAEPYRQQHFAPLFRQKSLKRAGRKSLEHYFLLSTIYKNRDSKNLAFRRKSATFSCKHLRRVLYYPAVCNSNVDLRTNNGY